MFKESSLQSQTPQQKHQELTFFEVKSAFKHKHKQILHWLLCCGLGCKTGDVESTNLYYDSLVRVAAHHLIDGFKELQQRLPEVCFSFVFIQPEKELGFISTNHSGNTVLKNLMVFLDSQMTDGHLLSHIFSRIFTTFFTESRAFFHKIKKPQDKIDWPGWASRRKIFLL